MNKSNKNNIRKVLDVINLITELSFREIDAEQLNHLVQATESMSDLMDFIIKLDKEEREQEVQVRSLQDENGMLGEMSE